MKKILAFLVAFACLMTMTVAMADQTVSLGSTSFKLTMGDQFESDTLSDEEINDGVVAYYTGDVIDFAVYQIAVEGETMEEFIAYEVEDFGSIVLQHGTDAVINGIPAGYMVYAISDEEGITEAIDYYVTEGDSIIIIEFYLPTEADSQLAADIMNTLTK